MSIVESRRSSYILVSYAKDESKDRMKERKEFCLPGWKCVVTLLYWLVARAGSRRRPRRTTSIAWLILFTCGRCTGGYARGIIYQFVGPHCRPYGSLLIVDHSGIERSHLFLLRPSLSKGLQDTGVPLLLSFFSRSDCLWDCLLLILLVSKETNIKDNKIEEFEYLSRCVSIKRFI